jgi:UDP-2,4-diacetamido-2,4,6-trideoxy-beta-L-altropyranose hydrolase
LRILIRTDGGVKIGNGHIIRMMALAQEFVLRKVDFVFALKQDEFWVSNLSARGYSVFQLPPDYVEELVTLIKNESITHLVYDTRDDLTREQIEKIKKEAKVRVVIIDSPENVRLAADAAIFPPILQLKDWSWEGFRGKIYSGWEYVLLRNEFSTVAPYSSGKKKILLSFGSTDPYSLTEWAFAQIELAGHLFSNYEFIVVVGPQFERLEKLRELPVFRKMKITILQAPSDLIAVFQSVDFAFIALGVTAYELAALSIPFLFVSISDDHRKSGEVFETHGLGISLGTLNQDLDHFEDKTTRFMNHLDKIKDNLEVFRSGNKICDWSKIINTILV